MFRGAPVIDADSHKIENPMVFLDYVDARFRGRVRVVTDQYGEQRVAITDRNPHTGAADLVRLYPQPTASGRARTVPTMPRRRWVRCSTGSACSTWTAKASTCR
jgi:hypothetical protein